MGYGAKLKHVLRKKGMSVKELSEKSGVSLNTLYSITKTDPFFVRQATLEKILPVFGLSAEEFANYDVVRLRLEDGTKPDDTKKIMIDQVSRIMTEVDNHGCVEIFKFAVQIHTTGEYDLGHETYIAEQENEQVSEEND